MTLDAYLDDPASRFATVAMTDTNGLLRGQTHRPFVVEYTDDLVQRACIDRLGHIQVAPIAQHPRHFCQRLPHQGDGHMVQRLEHQCQVKSSVGQGNVLRPGQHESQPLLRCRQVLGVLSRIGLQPGNLAARVAFQELTGQPRRATPQFNDVLIGQRNHAGKYR